MFNSQYYTCEQVDERLLQGYVDDYNTQYSQSLTKEQFLTKLGSIFAKETVIDNTVVNIGYFTCDTAAGTAAKVLTVAGYSLFQGGSIKVKFLNRNTAGSATLNINSQGAKALYYGGKAVSASNSWDNNEIVEIYYDGTSYYANNVEGNFKDGIFDISAYNLTEGQPTKYATLAEALGTNGNNVPPIFRKGGMQIKYVSTSDNKYVQYRLMSQTFSTTESNWQGVDDEPTPDSNNFVKSGGVYKDKRVLSAKANSLIGGFFLDYNHLVEKSSSNPPHYIANDGWDTAWVAILEGTTKITVSGAVVTRFRYFSTFNTEDFPTTQIDTNTTGDVPEGSVLALIAFKHSDNPDGYTNLVIKQNGGYVDVVELEKRLKLVSNGIFLDYNHAVDITSGNVRYLENSNWDCLWVPIKDVNILKITVMDLGNQMSYRFFSSYVNIVTANYLDHNPTGDVPSGAVVCLINIDKRIYDIDYSQLSLQIKTNYVNNNEIGNLFGDSIIIKNLIDKSNLLYGYLIDGGQFVQNANGIMSNKIVFENGMSYAFQNIRQYGSKHNIYIGFFDQNDNFLGRTGIASEYEEGSNIGNAIFVYNSATFPDTAYCRIVLKNNSTQVDLDIVQVERGDQYTEVVGYAQRLGFSFDNKQLAPRKIVKLLMIGNSYSQDALAYVPFIMQNMGVGVEFQIGILMQSSTNLADHLNNFVNETSAYTFYLYNGGTSWQNLGLKSIQWALDNMNWDIISLQQSSGSAFNWNTYQPTCNQLVNRLSAYVDYPVKFIWYMVQARPASSNSGANWSDDTITDHYESIAEAAAKLMNEAVFEVCVPVGTAIQNARTIHRIKALGDYALNTNNTSGLGYLTPNDGVHLQEGLPCQIAAYSFILSLLDIYGFNDFSIIGETTRVTSEWASGKNIPGPHGSYVGSTDENCIIAQMSAVMAMKKPYEVTDMNPIINPE